MIKKALTAKQKDDQRKELLRIVRSPMYTKKQKRIAACKWRFNQMGDYYREVHKNEYVVEWAKIQAQPDSDFESLTSF